jgi:hypothetical protein
MGIGPSFGKLQLGEFSEGVPGNRTVPGGIVACTAVFPAVVRTGITRVPVGDIQIHKMADL